MFLVFLNDKLGQIKFFEKLAKIISIPNVFR
jgi:hypothetical protein